MESKRNVVKSQVEIRWQLPEEKPSHCDIPQEKKLIRVAAYCRVSSELDRQMDSLEIQKRHYMSLVHNASDLELVGIYIDQGVTGTDRTKRSGFQRLIRHCEEGKIDRILCKSISRFGRNTADILDTIKHLKDKNIGVFFDKENIDTLSQNSEFVMAALAAIAQDEIRSLSENLKWSHKKRFQQGIPIFIRILGYDVKQTGGEIIISVNEEEAVIVREIFALALQDMSQKNIAIQMNEKGYKTIKGKLEWSGFMIKGVLSNERYTGDALCQKVYRTDYLSHQLKVNKGEQQQYLVENHHLAIISHDTFNQAQGLFGNPKKVVIKRKKAPLSGRVICGDCGAKYYIYPHGKNRGRGWQCYRSKSGRLCNSTWINELQLKEVIKKAFEIRYGTSSQSIIHRIKMDILRVHENDSFEKQRINLNNKLSTALKIEKCTKDNEREQAKEKRQQLEEKIKHIESYWNFIEEDRKYRIQALEWLDKLPRTERSSETLLQIINIECMRALVMGISVFSDGTYIVSWADNIETKVIENSNLKPKIQYRQRVPKAKGLKSLEDSVMRTDLLSQVINVNHEKTTNNKPIALSIPAIQDDFSDQSEVKRKRVCAYCRVSTNQKEQLTSFELQVSYYSEYILSNESWKFSGIYADEVRPE